MATVNTGTVYVGITSNLDNFFERKDQRRRPEVRISYEGTNGRQVETLCASGARVLAKALNEMADLADPPRKRS